MMVSSLLLAAPAFAKNAPSCFSARRAQGEAQYIEQLKQSITSRLQKSGITVRSIDLPLKAGDLFGYRTFVDFFLIRKGLIETESGTRLTVAFNNGEDSQADRDQALYIPVSTQDGFDREGNAINQHCELRLTFPADDLRAANTLWISNEKSGRILLSIPLPRVIQAF